MKIGKEVAEKAKLKVHNKFNNFLDV